MKARLILILLAFPALILSACAPALSQQDLQGTIEISIALTALAQTAAAPAATTAAPAIATVPPTAEAPGPEVVYLDVFGDAQAQIQGRQIDPFILYYRTTPDYAHIVSITIETVEPTVYTPNCAYKAQAIFEGGITAGWLICVTDGLVDWWLPECMGPCLLSDEFRAAYPEIVAILEP